MSCNGVVFVPEIDRWVLEKTLGSIVKEILGEEAHVVTEPSKEGYEILSFLVDGDYFDMSKLDEVGEVLEKDYPDAISVAIFF